MRRLFDQTRTGLSARLRQFARQDAGATAVEFAFVAGPFLFMMFALIELALVFLLSTSLDTAADRAARRIRTGEFQNASETATKFKEAICNEMTWIAGACLTTITVDVRVYDSFSGITDPLLTPSTTKPGKLTYNPGAAQFEPKAPPQRVVVVRSYYPWPLLSPFLSEGLARTDGSNSTALVTATQVFRTEPYQAT